MEVLIELFTYLRVQSECRCDSQVWCQHNKEVWYSLALRHEPDPSLVLYENTLPLPVILAWLSRTHQIELHNLLCSSCKAHRFRYTVVRSIRRQEALKYFYISLDHLYD